MKPNKSCLWTIDYSKESHQFWPYKLDVNPAPAQTKFFSLSTNLKKCENNFYNRSIKAKKHGSQGII